MQQRRIVHSYHIQQSPRACHYRLPIICRSVDVLGTVRAVSKISDRRVVTGG